MPATSAKWLLRLLVMGYCLTWASDGTAAGKVHVVVLTQPGTPLGSRLRAELVHLGFAVDEQDDGDPLQLVRDLSREQREGAVLRIETAGPSIELWLSSPSTDGSSASEVVAIASRARAHDDIVVRAIEVLRARLLERGVAVAPDATAAAPPARPEAAPPPPSPSSVLETQPSRDATGPRPASLWLGVGAGAVLNPGGPPLAGAVTLELAASPLPFLRVALAGSLPVLVPSVSTVEGSTKVGESLLGASLMLQRPPRAWPLEPYAGLGVAALWVHGEGSAPEPYVGHSVVLFGWVPFVRAGSRLLLSRRLALQLDVVAGWTVPTLKVTVVNRETATVGKPLLAGTLALAIGWAP
jgi:hypothetical protein